MTRKIRKMTSRLAERFAKRLSAAVCRNHIIQAAAQLLSQRKFYAASAKEIPRATGINKTTTLLWFHEVEDFTKSPLDSLRHSTPHQTTIKRTTEKEDE